MRHDLQRFKDAQGGVREAVTAELTLGRKSTHWMWFIFPQLTGLGQSIAAQRYGIADLAHARAYLNDETLGPTLMMDVITVTGHRDLRKVFGNAVDYDKFKSSMTLFFMARPDVSVFRYAVSRVGMCQTTLDRLGMFDDKGASDTPIVRPSAYIQQKD